MQKDQIDKKELIVLIYEHYHTQAFGSYYRVDLEKNKSLIDNFFLSLKEYGYIYSVGEYFLNKYIRFQIDYWINKDTTRSNSLSWVLGSKAIKRFFDVEDWESKEYWISKNTSHIRDYVSKKNEEQHNHEEYFKKQYHNTEKGFLNCIENTSLYSKTALCITCNYKAGCKKLLRENYPVLYKKRLK